MAQQRAQSERIVVQEPFGRIEALAKKAGYELAVTTDWGSLQSASRPFLKRLRVLDTTGVNGLAAMLGG